jgi:hypothetical protein
LLSSSASKGTIKGWAFLYLSAGILLAYLNTLGLLFIYGFAVAFAKKLWLLKGFAGFLPVVSWVLQCNSLIISTIHIFGMMAFSGIVKGFKEREIVRWQRCWVLLMGIRYNM